MHRVLYLLLLFVLLAVLASCGSSNSPEEQGAGSEQSAEQSSQNSDQSGGALRQNYKVIETSTEQIGTSEYEETYFLINTVPNSNLNAIAEGLRTQNDADMVTVEAYNGEEFLGGGWAYRNQDVQTAEVKALSGEGQPEPEQVSMDDTFESQGFEWNFAGAEVAQTFQEGEAYGGETVQGPFVVLAGSITNTTDEYITPDPTNVDLYTDQTSYNLNASSPFMDEEQDLFTGDVAPGASKEGFLAIGMDSGEEPLHMEWLNPDSFAAEVRLDLESISQSQDSGTEDTEGMEEEARQAVEDYYEAVNYDDWSYTYAHRDSRTRSVFTEEEWALKNQWFEDTNSTTTVPVSVNLDESSLSTDQLTATVERELTIDSTGASEIRDTTFVYEDGTWVVKYPEGGMPLYMPDTTFEEFVRANSG